jgi:hypothetical protein
VFDVSNPPLELPSIEAASVLGDIHSLTFSIKFLLSLSMSYSTEVELLFASS